MARSPLKPCANRKNENSPFPDWMLPFWKAQGMQGQGSPASQAVLAEHSECSFSQCLFGSPSTFPSIRHKIVHIQDSLPHEIKKTKWRKRKVFKKELDVALSALSSCQDSVWSNAGLDELSGLFQPNWNVCGMVTEALWIKSFGGETRKHLLPFKNSNLTLG